MIIWQGGARKKGSDLMSNPASHQIKGAEFSEEEYPAPNNTVGANQEPPLLHLLHFLKM